MEPSDGKPPPVSSGHRGVVANAAEETALKNTTVGDHKRKSLIWIFYFDGRERKIQS